MLCLYAFLCMYAYRKAYTHIISLAGHNLKTGKTKKKTNLSVEFGIMNVELVALRAMLSYSMMNFFPVS